MAHTFESVLKHFGDEAQLVGGAIIVRVGRKNIEVGRKDNTTTVFTLTSAGAALLEETKKVKEPEGKVQQKPKPKVEENKPKIDLNLDS